MESSLLQPLILVAVQVYDSSAKAIYVKDLTNLNKIRKKYSRINLNLDKKSEKVFNNMKSWFQKKKLGQDI